MQLITMIRGIPQNKKKYHYLTTKYYLRDSFRETQATSRVTSKNKWRRINSSDLNNNSKSEESSKDSQNISLIFMIRDKHQDSKEQPCLTTRFFLKEDFKEIQVISRAISKNKWRRISNSDLNNNSKLGENLKENQSMQWITLTKDQRKKERRQIFPTTK